MLPDFKVFRAPNVSGVGVPFVICVTHESAPNIVTVEWYLLVRFHQDAIAFFRHDKFHVDTTVNTDDVRNPQCLTTAFGEEDAMRKVQCSLAEYRASLSRQPAQPQQFPDVEFAECEPKVLAAMLRGGAGWEEFEHIGQMTASQELRHYIFGLLNTIPKRPKTSSPYPDEPMADPDLRTN